MAAALLYERLYFIEPPHRRFRARRAGASALESKLDQPLDEPRVLQLRRFPQLRIHRDAREAGDGVDLVDVKPIRAALEKEVDAREARCADGLERRDRVAAQLVALLLRQLRRDHELRGVVDIFVRIVVELAARQDLA